MGSSLPRTPPREEQIAVVEAFLDGIARGELDTLPVAPDLTVQSPLTPKLSGPAARDYLKAVAAGVKSIRVEQHIVEGEHVATLVEEETVAGPLTVFTKFRVEAGRIKEGIAFYDPRRLLARAPGGS